MSLRAPFVLSAVLSVVFGLSFVATPTQSLAAYGFTDPSAGHVYALRWFGVYLIATGVLNWMARGVEPSDARRAIVAFNLVSGSAGIVLALVGVLQGIVNTFGWVSVVIYLVLVGLLLPHVSARAPSAARQGAA